VRLARTLTDSDMAVVQSAASRDQIRGHRLANRTQMYELEDT
jgi:hypothetical protein